MDSKQEAQVPPSVMGLPGRCRPALLPNSDLLRADGRSASLVALLGSPTGSVGGKATREDVSVPAPPLPERSPSCSPFPARTLVLCLRR